MINIKFQFFATNYGRNTSGSGGYGGNGGNGLGGGGGGGYGADGGNGIYIRNDKYTGVVGYNQISLGGGGGGYGGNGGHAVNYAGYGGGYGPENYGRGGGSTNSTLTGKSGIVIITYQEPIYSNGT